MGEMLEKAMTLERSYSDGGGGGCRLWRSSRRSHPVRRCSKQKQELMVLRDVTGEAEGAV